MKRTVRTGPYLYMRGLIEGDTLLSLLFCLAILSLAHALKKQNGYRIRHSTVKSSIIHKYNIVYMDVLKLYTVCPEILVGRYFGGLLKLRHLVKFTLAVEQVLAIMIFIYSKMGIECTGNITGP